MRQRERVVLVHGLWMYPLVMSLMQHRIARCGYVVECWGYPTVRSTLSESAERFHEYCQKHKGETVHLVGHSMGGLIVLNAASLAPIPCLGRIVVAGTPLTGSFSARRLERWPGGHWMLGECIGEWLRGP